MKLKRLKKIYFLGIGGIGMSALARYFVGEGVKVYGYDLTETVLTRQLESEGMKIHYDEDVSQIPKNLDLVIVTPAIPADNKELQWFLEHDYPVIKRAEVLGIISKGMKSIAVAGTHGKTTTSSLITQLLNANGLDATAFLGGILVDSNMNFVHGKSEYVVLEADEYDRSFLHLRPDVLVILSMDADHLDVYGTVQEMRLAYEQLSLQVKKGGKLILGPGLKGRIHPEWKKQLKKRKIEVVKMLDDLDFENVRIQNARYSFDAKLKSKRIKNLVSNLPGLHNITNSLAAVTVARMLGVKKKGIRKALRNFKGIKRRFEYVYEQEGKTLIDDYAHHPEEIRNTVKTVKALYSDKKVLGIFQPHLYSRTKDFYKEFADELSGLDSVIVLPIYPAREEAIPGITSDIIYNLIAIDNKYLSTEKNLIKTIKKIKDFDVIITLGASDLDKHHKSIIKLLK